MPKNLHVDRLPFRMADFDLQRPFERDWPGEKHLFPKAIDRDFAATVYAARRYPSQRMCYARFQNAINRRSRGVHLTRHSQGNNASALDARKGDTMTAPATKSTLADAQRAAPAVASIASVMGSNRTSIARSASHDNDSHVVPLWKRAIDVTCIVMVSPVLLPVMISIGLMIKILSRGPVVFQQQRIGHRGKIGRAHV